MSAPGEGSSEQTPLIAKPPAKNSSPTASLSSQEIDIENGVVISSSKISSNLARWEEILSGALDGERLPYNDYTTIDWLHDLAEDSSRIRDLYSRRGIKYGILRLLDKATGWIAAAVIGILTACVAFMVDIAVATVADWKTGYCKANYLAGKEMCCTDKSLASTVGARLSNLWSFGSRGGKTLLSIQEAGETCADWVSWENEWSNGWIKAFAIYVAMALAYGIISGSVTMLTKKSLPAAAPGKGDRTYSDTDSNISDAKLIKPSGKVMYMAAGSGIPEIKTILSGFVIPNFLDLKVLIVKAVGSTFAVSTGMCLGKEGPFVHISTCVAYLVASLIPKYRNNNRKMREILSAGCASGLSVAFGAPIGGVLFSYEEISTYFPRKVLWRAFLCSLFAAITLKALNPTGTGKLVLFETNYGTSYSPSHYLTFVLLGVAGGVFGGLFCKANFLWSRHFRKIGIIKRYPVFEVALVTLATALLQYPNPVTREPGDIIIKNLLVDCSGPASAQAWVCVHENAPGGPSARYVGWLIYGTLVKLVLTTITFGIKVPSGIIIPALDAGAFFGRLVGLYAVGTAESSISPGIFAMVGAVAFLAGVSRMTISLAVIMLELTGELEYVVPYMVGILIAKWVADALEPEGVYDLAQTVLSHPFLDGDRAVLIAQHSGALVEELIPPKLTMQQITLEVPTDGYVEEEVLSEKLEKLKRRGLMDAGLVLVRDGVLQGYLTQRGLQWGLDNIEASRDRFDQVTEARGRSRLVKILSDSDNIDEEFDLAPFVNKTPLTISSAAPLEYVVEMFSKLGLRYVCVLEEGTGNLCGVILKKRLLDWLDKKKHY